VELKKVWIFTNLLHLETGSQVSLFNLYVPIILEDNKSCWETLRDFLQQNELENIILGGDLDLTLIANQKKGGSIVRDQAREWVEYLMSTWELEDIKPTKRKYTWSKKRVGSGHIAARLDRFLVQISFLIMGLNLSSTILSHSVSNHKTITLNMTTNKNLGPIPFCFNPKWTQEGSYPSLVARIWNGTVIGSPFFVWEEKLRRLIKSLKSWAKTLSSPIGDCQES